MPWSRWNSLALGAAWLCGAGAGSSAQELPRSGGAPLDLQHEAGALIDGLPTLREPADRSGHEEDEGKTTSASTASQPISAQAALARLEQARRKQVRWEKLARQGVLSLAEAERTISEVSEALVRYQKARVTEAQEQWETATKQFAAGQGNADLVAAAAAALASSRELSENAERQMAATRLRQAEVNAERCRRLYAERLISRHQYDRAQTILAQMRSVPASNTSASAAVSGK